MANYKVAYGKKENINKAIQSGIIPPGSVILTEDSNEIFFYSLDSVLDIYEEKYKFDSMDEAIEWVSSYEGECRGRILSIHHNGKCGIYVVNYDNTISPISGTNYVLRDKDPTREDSSYDILTHWINTISEEVYILVSNYSNKANWKNITSKAAVGTGDSTYNHIQSVSSEIWEVVHNLNKYPSVTIVDSSGNVVIGDVNYIDTNSLTIKFNGAFSGRAHLN